MIETQEMIARVKQLLPEATVHVNTDDNVHYEMIVIASDFEGMLPLKRQQSIMTLFQAGIASGDIHALSLKTWTPKQAANQA